MRYALCLTSALLFATATAGAQMAPPIPMNAAQFADSPTGQNVTLVVRVNRLARTALDADLLERVNDSRYKTTGKHVALYLAAETPFVMGSIADVKPGAIVFAYAVVTTAWHADVKKVIVVTPYVRVE
jgi:hypothetical protein